MTYKALRRDIAMAQEIGKTMCEDTHPGGLPADSQERKTYPLYSGLMCYFPRALAAVAHHSFVNNDKHNPGEPLHWAREKSADHPDALMRHVVEGDWLSAAWRALAQLELSLEAQQQKPAWTQFNAVLGPCTPADAEKLREAFESMTFEPPPDREECQRAVEAAEGMIAQGVPHTLITVPGHRAAPEVEAASHLPDDPHRPRAYIAGPMRGYPMFNWPAFKLATKLWKIYGYDITSPADMDEAEDGLDPIADPAKADDQVASYGREMVDKIVRRDIEVVMDLDAERGDCLLMLPGWRESTGAMAEYSLAKWRGLVRYDALTGKLLED